MALLFMEGWDKYGLVNSVFNNVLDLLTAGDWTSSTNQTMTLVAGLSGTGGFALQIGSGGNITKVLPSNYGRIIGGVRFQNAASGSGGIQFMDGASAQFSIQMGTTSFITVRNGLIAGTVLGTSSVAPSAGTTHYLEWDITLGNSASYQLWLDGVSVLSGTGDTTTTANNTINGITFIGASGASIIFDDLYLFDTSGSTNNAVLLTGPRVETQFVVSDGTLQSSIGAQILGNNRFRIGSNFNATANNVYLRPITPTQNCTISAIGMRNSASNSSVQMRPLLYSETAGAPSTLMSSGPTVVGTTAATEQVMALTTPQNLVAGTRYWIGSHNDIAVTSLYTGQDALAQGRFGASTFASGAPSTPPSLSSGQITAVFFGVVTGPDHSYTISQNAPCDNRSYVYDATPGHEDLYNPPTLSVTPSAIYATAVKLYVGKPDAGVRTVSMRQKSGSTDSAGREGTQAPSTTYGWLASYFETDPNGNIPWTLSALNAAQIGFKIEA